MQKLLVILLAASGLTACAPFYTELRGNYDHALSSQQNYERDMEACRTAGLRQYQDPIKVPVHYNVVCMQGKGWKL